MTDLELINAAKPPQPLADALLRQSEDDMEQLLELLFSSHQLVDDPDQTECKWYDCSHAWFVRRQYLDNEVHAALQSVAPTWEDAKRVALQWLESFPHECSEFDLWAYQRDELDDPSAISFLREMLRDRVPAKP